MDEDLDPDEPTPVALRELAAGLALIRAVARTMDADPTFSEALAANLMPGDLPALARLPEVGAEEGAESARLFLDRLDSRLRGVTPEVLPPIDQPPVTRPLPSPVPGIEIFRASRSRALVDNDLADAFVWWDDIAQSDIDAYVSVLAAASDERPLQRHLATHPLLLAQHLRGGHGRYVCSQKRLGSEFVCDFAVAEIDSGGCRWTWVELQSPVAKLFVPSTGRLTSQFDEGLRQINDWRRWLAANRDYARRPRAEDGLGLRGATGEDPGLLIIGREEDISAHDGERRRQLEGQYNIEIHSYDWLVREAAARLAELSRRAVVNSAD